jgi:hypothetical protein
MRNTLKLAVTTLLAAGLAACGDESTGLDNDLLPKSGEIGFSYSGAKRGTFLAKGALEFNQDSTLKLQSFAVATTRTDSSSATGARVLFEAVDLRLPRLDLFLGELPNLRTGTYSLNIACSWQSLPDNCAALAFGIDVDMQDAFSETGEFPLYLLTSGTLEVSSISNNRIRGDFQGTAKLLTVLADDLDFVPGADLTVTNGTFDLPLMDGSIFESAPNLLAEPGAGHSWLRPAASLLSR